MFSVFQRRKPFKGSPHRRKPFRDQAITSAYDYLKKRDLFPDADDDDDDEMVFGDEDFP
jgi:hypothetical protein